MKSLHDIEMDVAAMASSIAAPQRSLPTYGHSEDGARPHIEALSGAYHYVVVERGCELERRRTPDYQQLLYWVFADVTHTMAFHYELHHRVANQDSRGVAFAKQIELMARLSPVFAQRMSQDIARILSRSPYADGPAGGTEPA